MTANGTDAFLWYNVSGWKDYGLAIPNCSDDTRSQNATIRDLVQTTGRNLQAIMWHADSRLRVPPSINTLTRMHKLCIRARSILVSRMVPSGTPFDESAHSIPAPEDFLVFPVPYFKVRNTWLKMYAGLILTGLSDAMQHTENARPLQVSTIFAGLFGQYVQRVYRMMAIELLQVPLEVANAESFTLTDEMLRAYNPAEWFTQTEMIDTVPPLENWPTEDQLFPITEGIPASSLPELGRWPSTPTGAGVPEETQTQAQKNNAAFPQNTLV